MTPQSVLVHISGLALILIGAIFMVFAIVKAYRTKNSLDERQASRWLILSVFMIFFLVGYVLVWVVEYLSIAFPFQFFVSLIFCFGGIFAFLLIGLAKENIIELSQNAEALAGINKNLDHLVKEKTKRLETQHLELIKQNENLETAYTDLEQAEQRSKNSEEHLKSILRSTPIGIGQVSNRKFSFVNDQFAEMLGYTKGDLTGNISRMIYPSIEEFKRVGRYKYEEIKEKGTGAIETTMQKKDGTLIDVFLSSTPVNQNDLTQGVTFSALDITKRKQAEAEHRELESQLRQKYKMEAVGVMAGGMAHNFNNNLSIILGNIELTKMKLPNHPEVGRFLDNAKIGVLRSRDLISQIMTYSRKEEQHKAPLQLSEVIDEVIAMLKLTIPSSVYLQQKLSPASIPVYIQANASQIQEILLNLCNNAVHAMDEQGNLTIALDDVQLEQQQIPVHSSCSPGHYLCLSVQDAGCGMTPETQQKIFDPFFTTKELHEGTGMGLSSVHGIMEQLQGMIVVESHVVQGTTFKLYFPVIEATVEDDSALTPADLPRGKERILFVDDDEILATMTHTLLTEMGYHVTLMTDSQEAIKLFAANANSFDLLITDQTMPGLTGKELIQEIKQIRPDIFTIICTGYSSKIDEDKAKDLGINAFLMKPVDLPELLQTVRRVLDRD